MCWFLRSKIHTAIVTRADLNYVGSITIDADLVEKAGFLEGEKVLITSNTSGSRLETYVICGERGAGVVCMNGAAAHLIRTGEEVIIMSFGLAERTTEQTIILVDKENKFVRYL